MKNITITLPEEVARWARIYAARRGNSLSRVLGELLAERMQAEDAMKLARERYHALGGKRLRRTGQPLPARERLYER